MDPDYFLFGAMIAIPAAWVAACVFIEPLNAPPDWSCIKCARKQQPSTDINSEQNQAKSMNRDETNG